LTSCRDILYNHIVTPTTNPKETTMNKIRLHTSVGLWTILLEEGEGLRAAIARTHGIRKDIVELNGKARTGTINFHSWNITFSW